jgi:hypothetical protein
MKSARTEPLRGPDGSHSFRKAAGRQFSGVLFLWACDVSAAQSNFRNFKRNKRSEPQTSDEE